MVRKKYTKILRHIQFHGVLPPWDQGGTIFVSSARQEGFKSQGGDTFRGEKMILGSQAEGGTALS